MGNRCFCCGREINGISWSLINGEICDDCCEKALKMSRKLTYRNIKLYTGEEILKIINSEPEGNGARQDSTENQRTVAENEPAAYNYAPQENSGGKKSGFGVIGIILSIIAVTFVLCLSSDSEFRDKVTMGLAELLDNGSEYIYMVKDVEFADGLTYGDLLDSEYFDSTEWEYFENGGGKYVQYNGISGDDVLQVRFSLECVNKSNGIYLITPNQIWLNGVSVTDMLSLLPLLV